MSRPTNLTIDLGALRHNLQQVRHMTRGCKVMAMVKANAYGHGLVRVAQALSLADALGVASLEEGLILREAGIQQPIVLMEGLFDIREMLLAAQYHFTLVVHHLPHVDMLEKIKVYSPFEVWLKVNTGMHRLGVALSELAQVYQRLLAAPTVKKPIGLMTHFAEADLTDHQTTLSQANLFYEVTAQCEGPRSLANSAAIIAWPSTHQDWVRPGLMLYGASPFINKCGQDHGLCPVMTLSSRLIALTQVEKGGKIGYGGTWTAPETMKVGVVGVGYGDGYPQFASNGTPVLINGSVCPLVGKVSMDMLTVDLRSQPDAKIGDAVILWGEGLPVEYIADTSHTSAYEILTRMTPRAKVQVKV